MDVFTVPPGMPKAVFENKYARKKPDGSYQSWEERVTEMWQGNFSLHDPGSFLARRAYDKELERAIELAKAGILPLAGRHLQQGDLDQPHKAGEYLVNCSVAAFSFIKFWQLLKGCGVGRLYSGSICRVDWDNMPDVRLVLEGPDKDGKESHPDYEDWIETAREARHKYDSESERVRWFEVGDSAEGWAKIIEVLETAAFQEKHKDKLFIFDFSKVRPKGSPIKGQQGRPSSGPVPLMKALVKVASIKGAGMKPWKQALFIDHYLSACVVVGGIRRSSRIAVMPWRERDVIEFIDIKRGGHLYTANNSVAVDAEFWEQANSPKPSHGRRVFEAMCAASYFDKTGEPGFLNVDKLTWNPAGVEDVTAETLISEWGKKILDLHPKTYGMIEATLNAAKKMRYPCLTNPCSEIVLAVWGGYCCLADLCLAYAPNLQVATEGAQISARALVRANRMDFLYGAEIERTNRIGVSLNGIHEFAFRLFGFAFRDLLDEEKSQAFWNFIRRLKEAVEKAATEYALSLGMNPPHTFTCLKPGGTVPKVLSVTESANLPANDYYLRWVQYHMDDPQLEGLRARGYPVKDVSHQYKQHVVVGFPTKMPIVDLMGEAVVTASDVTIDEQYLWLELLEKYWLGEGNNSVSITLKYRHDETSYQDYMAMILEHQPKVRCAALMPQADTSAYAYTPEERISKERYEALMACIDRVEREAYDKAHLECEGGACPIEADLHT